MKGQPSKVQTDKAVQTQGDGAGPRYHRIYSVDLPVTFERAQKTMHELMVNPNAFTPELIATFEKTRGAENDLQVDDEFLVRISGPWNGPVRVTQVGAASFTLVTLQGHLEAGQIQFSLHSRDDGHARFVIESFTRSKDFLVNFIYDKLRFAQFMQSEMWQLVCENFAENAMDLEKTKAITTDKKDLPPVKISTLRQDLESGIWEDVSDQVGAQGLNSEKHSEKHSD